MRQNGPGTRELRPWYVRYPDLTFALVSRHLKSLAASRLDFFIGIGATLVIEGSGIALVSVVFDRVRELKGWTYPEVLFIYGLAALSRALYRMFFSNASGLPSAVMRGTLDRHLTKPMNTLFAHMLDIFQPNGIGDLFAGIVVISVVSPLLNLQWTPVLAAFVLLAVLSGFLIYCGITLSAACSAFWIFNSRAVIQTVFTLNDFARYPVSIYGTFLRFLLTWIVPFAFTSFYPAGFILRPSGYFSFGPITLAMGVLSFAAGYRIWLAGLKRYQSAGF